ncbi:hypothetical protein [Rhizobium lusitanum]|uniref:Uncharacterized protein n=1 Tax=Rhizobium lusitanum TaxID=293958 RepID=A0A1C3X4T8_9HYPH|nr:hypothetical protein [Rhizobium lusitanum]SCB47268.1 hypothetical protein GA0061101_12523 [Rhizobium lusitanum]
MSAADPILPDHIWGMITGTPYAETAIALTSVTAYCLKEGRERCHRVTADLINSLELLARRGQEMQRRDVTARQSDHFDEPEMFLSKLRSFLRKISESPGNEDRRRNHRR